MYLSSPTHPATTGGGQRINASAAAVLESARALGQRYTSPGGRLLVVRPESDVLVLSFRGRLDVVLARRMTDSVRELLEECVRAHIWCDWSQMNGYESPARLHLVESAREGRLRVGAIHILVGSRAVAMAVSVANLAAGGGLLSPYLDRGAWERALDQALQRRAAVGAAASAV